MFEKIKKYTNLAMLVAALSLSTGVATSCVNGFGESGVVGNEYNKNDDAQDAKEDIRPQSHKSFCYSDLDGDKFYGKNQCLDKNNNGIEIEIFEDGTYFPECPAGCLAPLNFDCNDQEKSINSGAIEKCNNIDDNCNGIVDEGLEVECFSECDIGKIVCEEGEWQECNAVIDCCEPGEIKDEIPCPYNPHQFIFVIDNSGSMEGSDYNNIRCDGLYLFVDEMKNEDEALLITFDDNPKQIGSFTSNKDELKSYISNACGHYNGTDIGQAMQLAISKFEGDNFDNVIMLLTDGHGSSVSAEEIKKHAEDKKVTIDSIGLGSGVEDNFLKSMITKDGKYYFISQADQIPSIYNEIFMKTKYKAWTECKENGKWKQEYGVCN
ncbi:VWA domain-containing protein [Candidatus Woesearchaeota archaeon]|jgi:uncharacterized protein YegL|nr:VWA domain-containing protein [Candidatus Woesearchaeota archaeon]